MKSSKVVADRTHVKFSWRRPGRHRPRRPPGAQRAKHCGSSGRHWWAGRRVVLWYDERRARRLEREGCRERLSAALERGAVLQQLKSGTGFNPLLSSGRRSAVTALLYAQPSRCVWRACSRASIEEKEGRNATTQLALVIALTRCAPLLLSMMMSARQVTLKQLEERITIIAEITARSRSQRRERARRKRENLARNPLTDHR